MATSVSKDNGSVKEEGELSEDDDDSEETNNSNARLVDHENYGRDRKDRQSRHSALTLSQTRKSDIESRSKDPGSRSSLRSKERQADAESRHRSYRHKADSGIRRRLRDHQDSRQISVSDNHTPSKFWENRRFRASSVRPLSPSRLSSSSQPQAVASPEVHGQYSPMLDNANERQDDLEELEREQEKIREQLKSLEEEEKNDEGTLLEVVDSCGKLSPSVEEQSNLAVYLEAENKDSNEEDNDEQELRRLALATSERHRHNRLLASEPQTFQIGTGNSDETVVVIPDVEPDLPEPEIVMVEEEEVEAFKEKNVGNDDMLGFDSSKPKPGSPQKSLSKGTGNSKDVVSSDSHSGAKGGVKSKVIRLGSKKRGKRKKKGEVIKDDSSSHKRSPGGASSERWTRELENLKNLALKDSKLAYEKFMDLVKSEKNTDKPIVTGTMKDFKRLKQIPVLTDEIRLPPGKPSSSVGKQQTDKKTKEKRAERKGPGQLEDNYEEVEMDIDSGSEKDEELSDFERLQLGADFSQAMQPVQSYNLDYQDMQLYQSVGPVAVIPQSSLMQGSFQMIPPLPPLPVIPPPLPPPPPPPPPLPSHEKEPFWTGRMTVTGDRNEMYGKWPVMNQDPSSEFHYERNRFPDESDIPKLPYSNKSFPADSNKSVSDGIGMQLHQIRLETEMNLLKTSPGNTDISSHEESARKISHLRPSTGRFHFDEEKAKAMNRQASCRPLLDYSSPFEEEGPFRSDEREGWFPPMAPRKDFTSSVEGSRIGRVGSSSAEFREDLRDSGRNSFSPHFSYPRDSPDYRTVLSPPEVSRQNQREFERNRSYSPPQSLRDRYLERFERERRSPPVGSWARSGQRRQIYASNQTSRSPSPPRKNFQSGQDSFHFGSEIDSQHFSGYQHEQFQRDQPSNRSNYSPPPRSTLYREASKDHHFGNSSYASQQQRRRRHRDDFDSLPHETQDIKRRRRSHDRESSLYEPEAPVNRLSRHNTPPPYIPTSIKPSPVALIVHKDTPHSSDSEEEDMLREKLLAEVIGKRKTTLEILSSNSTPLVMSPQLNAVLSESSETSSVLEMKSMSLSDPYLGRVNDSSSVNEASQEEEDNEDDIKPPPVLSRTVRQSNEPHSLSVPSKLTLPHASGIAACKPAVLNDGKNSTPSSESSVVQLPLNHEKLKSVDGGASIVKETDGSETNTATLPLDNKSCFWAAPRESSSRIPKVSCDVVASSYPPSRPPAQGLTLKSEITKEVSVAIPAAHDAKTSAISEADIVLRTKISTHRSATTSDTHALKDSAAHEHELIKEISSEQSALSPDMSVRLGPPLIKEISSEQSALSPDMSVRLGPPPSSGIWTENVTHRLTPSKENAPLHQIDTDFTDRILVANLNKSNTTTKMPLHLAEAQNRRSVILSGQTVPHSDLPLLQSAGPSVSSGAAKPIISIFPSTTDLFLETSSLSSHVNMNTSLSMTTQSHADSKFAAVQPSILRHMPVADNARTSSPLSDTTSHVSAQSSQSHTSGHINSYSGKWMYKNTIDLPVHRQVLVPLHSSSESEGEEEVGSEKLKSTLLDEERKKNAELALQSQQMMKGSVNLAEAQQMLRRHEMLLNIYKQNIQQNQETVKHLVNKALKSLEAQQRAEKKREKLRAEIAALTEQMRISNKIARSHEMQKENTETEVQKVTERLLRIKKLYAEKEKMVVMVGTKLFGPTYVPRTVKLPAKGSESSAPVKKLTRAQRIAQEKQKLKEKEKQIADRLKNLKDAKAKAIGLGKADKTEKQTNMITPKRPEFHRKSQDVIRIDKNADPDIAMRRRRKSFIDMNPSTTPDIPLTPRRSSFQLNDQKESATTREINMQEKESLGSSKADKVVVGSGSAFKMPTGTQLSHLCKLQREKTEKHLMGPHMLSSLSTGCRYASLEKQEASSACIPLMTRSDKKEMKRFKVEDQPYHSVVQAYSSPLLMFKSYRFNSYFRTKENLGFQSITYSNKINPNCVLCPYDLQGTCNDDSCQQQHPTDYRLSDHELLEDFVSYCPKLASVQDGAAPEEIKKAVVTYVDKFLSKHKGKMKIEELCLWLSAEAKEVCGKRHPHVISLAPRVWKPETKEETGLSLDLNQKLTVSGVEAIDTEKNQLVDRDAVINEEDLRYFTADTTELLALEAGILEDKTDIQLWHRLASKKLSDPNKTSKECFDQALSVLARGLEANRHDPSLWHRYLNLYRMYPEVKDFSQFCQTGLEYAPSYELWFMYLTSLKTYTEKEEACNQALEFLYQTCAKKQTVQEIDLAEGKESDICNVPSLIPQNVEENSRDAADNKLDTNNQLRTGLEWSREDCDTQGLHEGGNPKDCDSTLMCMEVEYLSTETENGETIAKNSKLNEAVSDRTDSTNGVENNECKDSSHDKKVGDTAEKTFPVGEKEDVHKLSHQILEMVLYKSNLNLLTGRLKTALNFLQAVLGLKKIATFNLRLSDFLTSGDTLFLWMTYIYVLEWHQLPPFLLSMTNQHPGKLLVKDSLTLPWASKSSLNPSVNSLVNLHWTAAKVWEGSKKDQETMARYISLVQSLVALLECQGRNEEAVKACRTVLVDKELIDIWLTLANLLASSGDIQGVKKVFQDALSANPYNPKLQFYQNLFLFHMEETELALHNLEQFVIAHFDSSSQNLLQCDPNLLYCQLLKQEDAFTLKMAKVKADIRHDLHKDIYMWLCYSLLMELEGETAETVEIFERSLIHSQTAGDLVIGWQNYISYLMRTSNPPQDVRDILTRSVVSVPTKFPVLFALTNSSVYTDHRHVNQLIEAWLAVLSPDDQLDAMELCLSFMPGNIQLLLRAIDLCLSRKETRRAYSWCKMVAAQAEKPSSLAFWKVAIALAQFEGTPREVERMLIGCVETLPLAVSGWKDFILFEVSRENVAAVETLLTHCQYLELNIDGFVATISAPS